MRLIFTLLIGVTGCTGLLLLGKFGRDLDWQVLLFGLGAAIIGGVIGYITGVVAPPTMPDGGEEA